MNDPKTRPFQRSLSSISTTSFKAITESPETVSITRKMILLQALIKELCENDPDTVKLVVSPSKDNPGLVCVELEVSGWRAKIACMTPAKASELSNQLLCASYVEGEGF